MFKRRRNADEPDVTAEVLDPAADETDADEVDADIEDADTDGAHEQAASASREGGPFDEDDAVDDDGEHLDLGALRVRPIEGVEVRLEVDEESGEVQGVTFVAGESAMQVGVFAAPRSEGIWEEVRTEIASQITAGGGTVDHREGPFGPELRATVRGTDDKGRSVSQALRFVGADGPRWFVRGLLSGPGVSNDDAAAPLFEAFRTLVVVRGSDPRAPHEPLPIHLPVEAIEDETPEAAGHDLNPFRRGPEITEIR